MTRILLDTRDTFDAGVCGFDHPVDPFNDGEGLIIHLYPGRPHFVELTGPNGSVELIGGNMIRETIKSLQSALTLIEQKATGQ